MWILTSSAFLFLNIQYFAINSWPLPEMNDKMDISLRYSELNFIVETADMEDKNSSRNITQAVKSKRCSLGPSKTITICDVLKNNESTIYVVTPTYRRPQQIAELTRMAQTLMLVPNIYWILVDDATEQSPIILQLLKRKGIQHIYLTELDGGKIKGAGSRNRAIRWIQENLNEGILYFADDDNTYDSELFAEMRKIEKVAMWPVGLVSETGLSTPIVKDGKFVGFYDGWVRGQNRKFPVDMAGFAVNITFLKQRPKAIMDQTTLGYQEDSFLQSLAPFEPNEIELKANNCTKVLVWHTKTQTPSLAMPVDEQKYCNTNLMELKKMIV